MMTRGLILVSRESDLSTTIALIGRPCLSVTVLPWKHLRIFSKRARQNSMKYKENSVFPSLERYVESGSFADKFMTDGIKSNTVLKNRPPMPQMTSIPSFVTSSLRLCPCSAMPSRKHRLETLFSRCKAITHLLRSCCHRPVPSRAST